MTRDISAKDAGKKVGSTWLQN